MRLFGILGSMLPLREHLAEFVEKFFVRFWLLLLHFKVKYGKIWKEPKIQQKIKWRTTT